MAPRRPREILLAVLAVVLVVAVVWSVQQTSSVTSTSGSAGGQAATPGQKPEGALTEIDLQALKRELPEPADTPRNPFRFRPKPPPPPPSPARRTPTHVDGDDAPPAGPPPPPPIPLKFIGKVAGAGGVIAILADGRGVYQGREGDTIEGRYRILRIGVESVELAYVDGRGRQTIRYTGQ